MPCPIAELQCLNGTARWKEARPASGGSRSPVYNRAEREAVKEHAVQCFCLSSQSLSANDMAARYLDNLDAVTEACLEPGPFIYAVHTNRIERLPISQT